MITHEEIRKEAIAKGYKGREVEIYLGNYLEGMQEGEEYVINKIYNTLLKEMDKQSAINETAYLLKYTQEEVLKVLNK